jgi:hypothetical protein
MTDESSEALQVGVGVAATCIGVMCSLYHCCCHVWRRLKGHTPAVAAGAAVAAGVMAAGQLASGVSASAQLGHRYDPGTLLGGDAQPSCARDERTCRVDLVCTRLFFIFKSISLRDFGSKGKIYCELV